ncbi:hypothetical protein F4679DRAFT_592610 [Xylaria curta]|nr:hypothetical protein F4679DRAFT_592610 [Xylaria curta]
MSIPDNKQDEFTRATVWSAGVNDYIPPEQDNLYLPKPVKWLDALENIQSHRQAPVTAGEIDEAIQFRADALPAGVNRLISIPSASNGYEGFWDINYKRPEWGRGAILEFEKENYESEWIVNNQMVIEDNLIKHPYHMWPINTGKGHWEVIFMVFERTPDHPAEYRQLSRYAIIDPRLSGGKPDTEDGLYGGDNYSRAKFVDQQLERFFMAYPKIQRPGNPESYERMIWVPQQKEDDHWSSGLRIIQFAWEMLERIQDMETSGIRNIHVLFRPMRPYFNPDYVRLTAAGAIAARGLETENFRARITLARVHEIRPKGRSKKSERLFASDLFAPLALPPVEKIPQLFLDAVSLKEGKDATWKFVTHRDQIDRKEIPGLLESIANRYRAQLQKEEQEKQEEEQKKKEEKGGSE